MSHRPANGAAHVLNRASSRKGRSSAPTELAKSLSQQAQVFDISQDAIFLWRKPGGIQFWSKGATDLYGYSEKQALGKVSHLLLKTKFPLSGRELKSILQSKGSWEGELRQVTRDRREIFVSARLQLISERGGKMLVLESTRDITEMKQNQERLEQHLREQAVTTRFSLDALQATSVQMICDDAVNTLARELKTDFSTVFELLPDRKTMLVRSGMGWRPGAVGVTQIDLREDTAMSRALRLNQPIVVAKISHNSRVRLPRFLREHAVASSMAVVIQGRDQAFGVLRVDSKKPRHFSADEARFLEDIGNVLATAVSRTQFEQELRETAARLKGIVETAVDGIITINERGLVETMNPAAERIFGYRASEVIGRNVSMLMPEPYRSQHDGYIERYRRTGERRIIGIGREVRGRRKDGSEFPMDLAVSENDLGSRQIFTGLLRDISARKQLEEEIIQISEHEQRRIGSDLHDDLCQQLAGIRFGCDVLKRQLANNEDSAIRERVAKLEAELSRAIDHTRILARGMAPVALEKNGLASALEELANSLHKLFGVQCIFTAKANLAINDVIAATHLYRIAQEAITNGLKHGQATKISVTLDQAGDRGILQIKDNGCGFTRVDANDAQGMGLRTIRYRAGMIPAYVQIKSIPNRGTTITCTFATDL